LIFRYLHFAYSNYKKTLILQEAGDFFARKKRHPSRVAFFGAGGIY